MTDRPVIACHHNKTEQPTGDFSTTSISIVANIPTHSLYSILTITNGPPISIARSRHNIGKSGTGTIMQDACEDEHAPPNDTH